MFRQKMKDQETITIGYMEAKSECRKKEYEPLKCDLVRLGIFGKNSIDTHKVKNSFLVQAIGTELTFYIILKKTADVSVMLELD